MMMIILRKFKTLLLIKDNHTNTWHLTFISERIGDGYVGAYGIRSVLETEPRQLCSQ